MKIKIENYENSILDENRIEWWVFIPEILSELDSEGIDYIEYPKGIDLKKENDQGEVIESLHIESLATIPDQFKQRKVNDLEEEISEAIYNDKGISPGCLQQKQDKDFWNYTQK